MQDTEDSKMRVVVVRTYGGATSSFCSSGISYWFVMKEIAWGTNYSRADLWHLTLKLSNLGLRLQERCVGIVLQ